MNSISFKQEELDEELRLRLLKAMHAGSKKKKGKAFAVGIKMTADNTKNLESNRNLLKNRSRKIDNISFTAIKDISQADANNIHEFIAEKVVQFSSVEIATQAKVFQQLNQHQQASMSSQQPVKQKKFESRQAKSNVTPQVKEPEQKAEQYNKVETISRENPQALPIDEQDNNFEHLSVIKTNYTKSKESGKKASASMAYGASHGTKKSTGELAKSSGTYQNRNSALSQEQELEKAKLEQETGLQYSNTFDKDGQRLTRQEFKEYQKSLADSELNGMRRIIISPNPELNITPDEMVSITRDTMQSWAEQTGKKFDFTFAVHDGQSELHSHVTMTSVDENAVNMGSKQLETFKGLADRAIKHQLELRQELTKHIEIEQELAKSNKIEESLGQTQTIEIDEVEKIEETSILAL